MVSGSVYRHLEREWVDDFFSTGRLQLTTLAHCREHDKSSRADPRDGRITFSIQESPQLMAGVSTAGMRSYMLCASRSYARPIQTRFNTDSWIEIVDVAGFADAVAHAIGCTDEALVGGCLYTDAKQVDQTASSSMTNILMTLYKTTKDPGADLEIEFNKTKEKVAQFVDGHIGDNSFFMKNRVPYEIEEEVRFAWPVDRKVDGQKVFLCPGARDFCKAGP